MITRNVFSNSIILLIFKKKMMLMRKKMALFEHIDQFVFFLLGQIEHVKIYLFY